MVTETQAMELEQNVDEILEECTCEQCGECLDTHPILFTEDDVKEIIEEVTDFIQLDKEVLLDNDDFYDGMIDGMRIAGMYTVLRNVGISEEKAIELILNDVQIEHECCLIDANNKTQIELEKIKSKNVFSDDILED